MQKDISENVESTTASGLVLKDIGNLIQIRKDIDKNHRATSAIRSRFFVADFIPLRYNLNYKVLQVSQSVIKYNFSKAIKEYQDLCLNYNMDNKFAGLRLWMTSDTTVTENLTNEYTDNLVQSKIASISGIGQTIRDFAKASGTEVPSMIKNVAGTGIASGVSALTGVAASLGVDEGLTKVVGESVSGLLGTAAELVIDGKAISLPKVWKNSTYNPAVSFTVKLVSPYGSPRAINRYVLEPLLYILLLTSPRTVDGISYGLPRPVRVRAYGLTNINLGMIQNVTINRGGSGTSFNQYKQPLSIDVVITVSPLTDGFASVSGDTGSSDMVKFNKNCGEFEDKTHTDAEYSNFGNTSAITTVGNIIQSLAPAPDNVAYQFESSEPTVQIEDDDAPIVTPNESQTAKNEVNETNSQTGAIDPI